MEIVAVALWIPILYPDRTLFNSYLYIETPIQLEKIPNGTI